MFLYAAIRFSEVRKKLYVIGIDAQVLLRYPTRVVLRTIPTHEARTIVEALVARAGGGNAQPVPT